MKQKHVSGNDRDVLRIWAGDVVQPVECLAGPYDSPGLIPHTACQQNKIGVVVHITHCNISPQEAGAGGSEGESQH